ncbi:DUF2779 domain-containing protein [Erysipelotrichaceae bacterium RD49]|nr:DUF2779 domain-containing protein [Erysipelotrichaceae bacterium RD49]
MPTTNKKTIHANELASAIQCPRKALLARTQMMPPILRPDHHEYQRMLEKLLEKSGLQQGRVNDPTSRSLEILKQDGKGRDLRFEAKGLRTTIPVMVKKEDGTYKAMYPICSTAPKENLLASLFIDTCIVELCGLQISEHEFLYLDKTYIRQKEAKPEDFFAFQNHVKKMHGGYYRQSVDEQIAAMRQLITPDELADLAWKVFRTPVQRQRARHVKLCTSPSKCPFYNECWGVDDLPDNAAPLLSSSSSRNEFEEQGIYTLDQIKAGQIEGTGLQYAQIQAAKNPDGLFMDRPALQEWMDELVYPITYLDFEWDTFALAPYPGMKAFGVLCFQYSMHIEHDDGRLEHSVYFSTGDCREDFILHLLEEIPASGSIMVFNMEGAEKLRLMQLAEQFPAYRQPLEALCARMVDLSVPFETGSYYDLRQRGKSSLKTLLPLFSKHDGYKLLDVQNGMDAVFAYRKASSSKDPKEKEQIAQEICDYCSMDTYAERELFLGLKKKLEG